MKIYHCEDSLEGIFTAIYNTYEDHCIIRDTMVTTIEENLLFSESVEVIPDPEKTIKVIRTLKRRFGETDYETLCLALVQTLLYNADPLFSRCIFDQYTFDLHMPSPFLIYQYYISIIMKLPDMR